MDWIPVVFYLHMQGEQLSALAKDLYLNDFFFFFFRKNKCKSMFMQMQKS